MYADGAILTMRLRSVKFESNRVSARDLQTAGPSDRQRGVALFFRASECSTDSHLTDVEITGHVQQSVIFSYAYMPWRCQLGKWMQRSGELRSQDFVGCAFECALGHYGDSPDLDSSDCTGVCPAGTMCRRGSSAPESCRAGSHSKDSGSVACSVCGVGTFANASGASECMPCPPGSLSSLPNATECTRIHDQRSISAPWQCRVFC